MGRAWKPGEKQSSCARDEDDDGGDGDSVDSEAKVNSKDCEEVKNEFNADATANQANLRTSLNYNTVVVPLKSGYYCRQSGK